MDQPAPTMDDFQLDILLPAQWSDTDSEGTPRASSPIGTSLKKAEEGHSSKSTSYTFHPYFAPDGFAPDLVLKSLDHVLFHVHRYRILSASGNAFAMLCQVPPELSSSPYNTRPPTVVVPEPSGILNIILHAIYRMIGPKYSPSFNIMCSIINAFPRYGLSAKLYATVGQPLYPLIVSCAPKCPIDTYALAAAHDLADAAITTSTHLLSFPILMLSDELAVRMGPIYLKKLFSLLMSRMDALKRIMTQPPSRHSETPDCSTADQMQLARAWALTAVAVLRDAGPGLSTSLLQLALGLLHQNLKCTTCCLALRDRVACAVTEWASLKRTI